MEITIGSKIQTARTRMGWEQSDLTQYLSAPVSQQTVSRWERGGSRPRRNLVVELAKLFGEDPVEFLEAAGYTRGSEVPDVAPRPIRPWLTVLPVWDLAPEKFEELVADLGQELRPDAFVSRFGGQGHTQYGVDIVAEKDSRYVLTFQCKRVEEFGRHDVRNAVAKVTVEADAHILAISRRSASPASRREMQLHPGWTLWDAQDISRNIRGLPLDRSLRIVETYFPGWREDFLGVPEPGPWLEPNEFFQSFSAGAFYSHDWTLVGRDSELAELLAFISDSKQQVGLLVGRGGIGKSKLLWEVSRAAQAQGVNVRFLKSGIDPMPRDLELLPIDGQLLVIIDDAHDRGDLKGVLADLLRLRSDTKVLFALRPFARPLLAIELRQSGRRIEDSLVVTLSDLSQADAEALAIEALGPEWPRHLGQRLGILTRDSPFITVVAGILIRRGLLDPACLDHENSVRSEIVKTFRDVLVADSPSGEFELRRSVLDAMTALQPFRASDPHFQRILGRLIDRPYDRAFRHIRALEGAGVLMRRGDSLRVVPDLLSDMILSEASFDEGSNAPTGYLERVWNAAEGEAFQHIFVNAARIDWQVRHDDPNTSTLMTTLWDAIDSATRDAGIVGRLTAVKLLKKVAYFQPARSIELVRWIIGNPTDVVEDNDELLLKAFPPTSQSVLNEIPEVVKAISYNMSYLRESMEILWDLAANDNREIRRYPEHPMRILRSIAEIHRGKPIEYNVEVVNIAQGWLEGSQLLEGGPSPFDVLEPMLATEGSEDFSDGYAVRFQPYSINPAAVGFLRERIIALALGELRSRHIWRATAALRAIQASLSFPVGLFGRRASEEEIQGWIPSFLQILDLLRTTVSEGSIDPAIAVAVRHAIQWHLEYSKIGTRDAARRVIEAIPDTLEIRAAVALFDGWGHLLEGRTTDIQEMQRKSKAQRDELAAELIQSRSQEEIMDLLEARIVAQRAAFGSSTGSTGPFLWSLVERDSSLGLEICERAISDLESPLAETIPVVMGSLAEVLPDKVVPLLQRLLATESLGLRRSVAQSLGWNRGSRQSLLLGEYEIILDLASDADTPVRQFIVRAIERLSEHHPTEALSLIAHVEFRDSPQIADDVFTVFTGSHRLKWGDLAEADANSILDQLLESPSIEEYWVQEFLRAYSKQRPKDLIRFL
ncbi:MAG: helix-turn-helix domain-containing protein, partial [Acidobacteria bacterium]|nr:helix-turn-helix domain-containing protein [Acidobacteriota bacterium]